MLCNTHMQAIRALCRLEGVRHRNLRQTHIVGIKCFLSTNCVFCKLCIFGRHAWEDFWPSLDLAWVERERGAAPPRTPCYQGVFCVLNAWKILRRGKASANRLLRYHTSLAGGPWEAVENVGEGSQISKLTNRAAPSYTPRNAWKARAAP